MSTPINKKTLEYLSELSRIELDKESEEKLLKDLQKILTYFEELKEVDTENIEPMAGGTIEKNIFREDTDLDGQSQREPAFSQRRSALIEQFPEEENGFLKVPAVFE
jgi:aspartyl-tRNA(Asn)/glutamyl-tRNA(Gln) amidotransferase subunit C